MLTTPRRFRKPTASTSTSPTSASPTSAARRFAALAGATVLTVPACGEAPTDDPDDTAGGSGEESYSVCMVLDEGGPDDKSFNQSAIQGMEDAAEAAGNVETSYVQSQAEADYEPNVRSQAEQCDAVIATGGLLQGAIDTVAPEFPDVDFAIVDGASTSDNVYAMTFATEQSGFLGGYVAASLTETGAVATYGGINIGAPVTGYMEGYRQGVEYFNEQNGTEVRTLGWDGSDGSFAGSFADPTQGRQVTDALVQQGADVVFPVAGGSGAGSFAAAEAAGGSLKVIWVDFPGCDFYPEYCEFIPTSVTKAIPENVAEFVEQAAGGDAPTGGYVGTLENDGTGIDAFNEFDTVITDDVKADLEEIRSQIVDGSLVVEPPA